MEIEELVKKILKEEDVSKVPIPVDEIIRNQGIRLIEKSLPDGVSGVLDLRTTPTILINEEHHINRQRFSMAHELGHFMLHNRSGVHVDRQTFYRNKKSSEGLDYKEIVANKFAALLLMPNFLIQPRTQEILDWIDMEDDMIPVLAEEFQVSVTAMSIRLQSLGIVSNIEY